MNKTIVGSGFQSLIERLAQQRDVLLSQLKSGYSIVNVAVRGKKLLCIYKRHDKSTITVESTKGTLDWMFRGKDMVLLGGDYTPEEITFNLVDVEISGG